MIIYKPIIDVPVLILRTVVFLLVIGPILLHEWAHYAAGRAVKAHYLGFYWTINILDEKWRIIEMSVDFLSTENWYKNMLMPIAPVFLCFIFLPLGIWFLLQDGWFCFLGVYLILSNWYIFPSLHDLKLLRRLYNKK